MHETVIARWNYFTGRPKPDYWNEAVLVAGGVTAGVCTTLGLMARTSSISRWLAGPLLGAVAGALAGAVLANAVAGQTYHSAVTVIESMHPPEHWDTKMSATGLHQSIAAPCGLAGIIAGAATGLGMLCQWRWRMAISVVAIPLCGILLMQVRKECHACYQSVIDQGLTSIAREREREDRKSQNSDDTSRK